MTTASLRPDTRSPMATMDPRLQAIEDGTAPGLRPDATRNVIDKYRAWTIEQIIADLETRRTDLVSVLVNVEKDFNKAAVIRANNAFTGRRVVITERRPFNKRGTVGTHNYEHVEYAKDTFEVIARLIEDGYTVFAVDNTPEFQPQAVQNVKFPAKTALLYGEEGTGLPAEAVALCNGGSVYIPQYGSVRSLNVSQAAAVMFYAYDLQHPVTTCSKRTLTQHEMAGRPQQLSRPAASAAPSGTGGLTDRMYDARMGLRTTTPPPLTTCTLPTRSRPTDMDTSYEKFLTESSFEVLYKPSEFKGEWEQFHGLDGVDTSDRDAILVRLQAYRDSSPDLADTVFQLVKVGRTLDMFIPAGYDPAPKVDESSLHAPRADGMDLCEYDDEDWPCAYVRRQRRVGAPARRPALTDEQRAQRAQRRKGYLEATDED